MNKAHGESTDPSQICVSIHILLTKSTALASTSLAICDIVLHLSAFWKTWCVRMCQNFVTSLIFFTFLTFCLQTTPWPLPEWKPMGDWQTRKNERINHDAARNYLPIDAYTYNIQVRNILCWLTSTKQKFVFVNFDSDHSELFRCVSRRQVCAC